MSNGKTFVKITNRDIYVKIESMERLLQTTIEQNRESHLAMRKDCLAANASVKSSANVAKMIAMGAIGVSSAIAAWFMAHLLN